MSAATAHWTKQFQQLRKFLQGHNEKHILLALDNISGAYQKYKVQRAQNKGYEETWNELQSYCDAMSDTGLYHAICRLLSPTHGFTKNIQAAACETLSVLVWNSNRFAEPTHPTWYLRKQSMIGLQMFEMNGSQYTTLLLLSYILSIDESTLKNLFRTHNESNSQLRLISNGVKLVWALSTRNNAIQNKMNELSIVSHILTIFKCVYPISLLSTKSEILNLTQSQCDSNPKLKLKHAKITFANYIIINCLGALTSLLGNAQIREIFLTNSGMGNDAGGAGAGDKGGGNRKDPANLYLILQCLHHNCVQIKVLALQFVNSICVEYPNYRRIFFDGFPVLYLNENHTPRRNRRRQKGNNDNDGNVSEEESDDDVDEHAAICGMKVLLTMLNDLANDAFSKCKYKPNLPINLSNGDSKTGKSTKSGKQEIEDDGNDEKNQENENENEDDNENSNENKDDRIISSKDLVLFDISSLYSAENRLLLRHCLECLGHLCDSDFQAQKLFAEFGGCSVVLKVVVIFDIIENYILQLAVYAQFAKQQKKQEQEKQQQQQQQPQQQRSSSKDRSSSAGSNTSFVSNLNYVSDGSNVSISSQNSQQNGRQGQGHGQGKDLPKYVRRQLQLWRLHRDYISALFGIIAGFVMQPKPIWIELRTKQNRDASNSEYERHRKLIKKLIGKFSGALQIEIDTTNTGNGELSKKRIENVLIPYLVKHLIYKVNHKQSRNVLVGSLISISVLCQSGLFENNIFKVLTSIEFYQDIYSKNMNNNNNNNSNNANGNNNNSHKSVFSRCLANLLHDPCRMGPVGGRLTSYMSHLHLINALREIVNCIMYDKSCLAREMESITNVNSNDNNPSANGNDNANNENKTEEKKDNDIDITTAPAVNVATNGETDNKGENGEQKIKDNNNPKMSNINKRKMDKHDKKRKLKDMLINANIFKYLCGWIQYKPERLQQRFDNLDTNTVVYLKTECAICLSKIIKYDPRSQTIMAHNLRVFNHAMKDAYQQQLYALAVGIMSVIQSCCYDPKQPKNIELVKGLGTFNMVSDMRMAVVLDKKLNFLR